MNDDFPDEKVPSTATIGHHGTCVVKDSSRERTPSRYATLSSSRKLLTTSRSRGFSCSRCASSVAMRCSMEAEAADMASAPERGLAAGSLSPER